MLAVIQNGEFNLKSLIVEKINKILNEQNIDTNHREMSDSTVLLDSGLDSLGFAILVTTLEEELGYDPFQIMEDAVYPVTLGEFVAIYDKYKI